MLKRDEHSRSTPLPRVPRDGRAHGVPALGLLACRPRRTQAHRRTRASSVDLSGLEAARAALARPRRRAGSPPRWPRAPAVLLATGVSTELGSRAPEITRGLGVGRCGPHHAYAGCRNLCPCTRPASPLRMLGRVHDNRPSRPSRGRGRGRGRVIRSVTFRMCCCSREPADACASRRRGQETGPRPHH